MTTAPWSLNLTETSLLQAVDRSQSAAKPTALRDVKKRIGCASTPLHDRSAHSLFPCRRSAGRSRPNHARARARPTSTTARRYYHTTHPHCPARAQHLRRTRRLRSCLARGPRSCPSSPQQKQPLYQVYVGLRLATHRARSFQETRLVEIGASFALGLARWALLRRSRGRPWASQLRVATRWTGCWSDGQDGSGVLIYASVEP